MCEEKVYNTYQDLIKDHLEQLTIKKLSSSSSMTKEEFFKGIVDFDDSSSSMTKEEFFKGIVDFDESSSNDYWEVYIKGIVDFDDSSSNDYWEVYIKSYDEKGNWFGSQYKLLTAPKFYTLDDFLYHYTDEFHGKCFSRRTHSYSNKIYLNDNKSTKTQLIYIYLNNLMI